MMRNILYSITVAAIAAVAFVSCSKSDIPVSGYPADGVVRISPTVAEPVTRADGEVFKGSELSLGLFYGANDKYNRTTSLWTKDELGNWNSETPVLWKNAEDEVEVYAFAPYSSMGGRYASFSIPSDQSAGLEEADMLWYSDKVTPGSLKDGKLDVVLNHALLKLTVNLGYGDELGDAVPKIKEVWLNGTMPSFHCNLNFDGRGGLTHPTAYRPLDIKMHKVSDLCYEAIFYPSDGQKAGGNMLTVILSNGRDYHLTLSEDLAFEKDPRNDSFYLGGTAYEMSVKIGRDKLKMGAVTVAPWNDKKDFGGNHFTDATEYSEWGGPEDVATEYAGGDGSEGNPYQIATAAQLAFLAQEANKEDSEYKWVDARKYFKLTANINLKGHEWTPIGTAYQRFVGSFDGDNHTIVNLSVKDAWYAGLFGWIQNGATVKNLVIRNASVSSVSQDSESVRPHNPEAYSGIVAAYCSAGCTISNCKVDGIVTSDYCAGGIVGYSANNSNTYAGTITDCTADVVCSTANTAKDAYCGGIAGIMSVKMYGCTVRGKVDGTVSVGGLVGWLAGGGTIGSKPYVFNYVSADVSLSSVCIPNMSFYDVGGLVGSASYGTKISSCYMYGRVWCAEGLVLTDVAPIYVGGVIGYTDGVELSGCYSFARVTAGKPANGRLGAGAFIGYLGAGVKAAGCTYQIDLTSGLPVYGCKAGGADDSEINVDGLE